jgi:TolB protein
VTPDHLDRPLTAWLEGEAAMRAPDDLLPQVIERAGVTRRRPGWATTERWISMETHARLGAVPRTTIVFGTLTLMSALAAGAITLGAGGSSTSALPPTGPAGNGLMAYSSDGDIWVMNPDGSEPRRLTSGPGDDHSAAWSRDGTRLAYWSVDESGSSADLVVMAADGSQPLAIFTDEGPRGSFPVDWSPDGSRVAFTLCPDPMCGDFFVVASDGSGSSMVGGPTFEGHRLLWSPDGSTIAFGGRHGSEPRGVYLIAPDGTDVRRISEVTSAEPPHFSNVDWSPDGTRVLTHAGVDGEEPDLWSVAADGTGEIALTEGPTSGYLPRWSPDGAWVAFRGDDVLVVPGAGGEARRIAPGEDFVWSPDGTVLAVGGGGDLRIFDVQSGDLSRTIEGVDGIDSWQRVAP